MNIKPLGIKIYQNNLNAAKETKKAISTPIGKKEDTITISRHAMEKREVRESSAAIASQINAPADQNKLNVLKAQYQNGEYKVDEDMLVKNLLKGIVI